MDIFCYDFLMEEKTLVGKDSRYTPQAFADLVGVSVKTLQRWDEAGKLKAYRTPKNRRFYTNDHLKQMEGVSSNEEIRGKLTKDIEDIELGLCLIATGVKKIVSDGLNKKIDNLPISIKRGVTILNHLGKSIGGDHFSINKLVRNPINKWGLMYYEELFDGLLLEYHGYPLYENGYYTELCETLALKDIHNSELEYQLRHFKKLFANDVAYGIGRDFLSKKENSILDGYEMKVKINILDIDLDYKLAISQCYEPVSTVFCVDGHIHCCPYCGYPLRKHPTYEWYCIDDRCRKIITSQGKAFKPERKIPFTQNHNFVVIKQSIRNSIAYPGQLELYIQDRIFRNPEIADNVKVTVNPFADAADIQLEFKDGTVWFADAKHYESATNLIKHIRENKILKRIVAKGIKYDRGFLIVPNYVENAYLEKLRANLIKKEYNIDEVVKVSQFIQMAKRKVGEVDED